MREGPTPDPTADGGVAGRDRAGDESGLNEGALHEPAPREAPPRGPDREEGAGGLDLQFVLAVLRRHKYLIVGLTVLVTAAAWLYVNQLTPLYRAHAEIVLDTTRENITPYRAVVQESEFDWRTAQTEATIIESRELARKAVKELNLAESRLFNPRRGSGEEDLEILARAKGYLRELRAGVVLYLRDLGVLGGDRASDAVDAEAYARRLEPWQRAAADTAEDPMTRYLTNRYLSGLNALTSDSSRVIAIRYVSVDPEFAAIAANTTARLYIEQKRQSKGQATTRAAQWLEERVQEARTRLLESERKLEAFRRQSGLGPSGGLSLPAQQLAQLNSNLVAARSSYAEARASYEQVAGFLEGGNGDVESAAAVLDSDLIEKLRIQEIELNRRIAELETQYRESHPKMINARAELKNLQEKIQNEVDKIAARLRNEMEVAQIRVRNLETEVQRLQTEIDEMNSAEVKLQALEGEVQANRDLYQTLLQRFKETSIQDDAIQQADARLVNPAQPPGAPFYPNTGIFVTMAFVFALGGGVSLAFLLEYLDAGFRTLGQVESQLGVPALGMVPKVKLKRGQRPHSTLATRQGSVFAESIRALRTAITLSRGQRQPRVVMVTSTVPSEGKSSTTLSIAAQTIEAGRRCLVIDCDLRVANLGNYLGYPDRVGLSDFLAGNARLDEVIEIDPASGVHFIAAGAHVLHPDEILGSERMRSLIRALAEEYSLVVLDTPPVLAVADALMLTRLADMTLYLVHWGETRRQVVKMGLKRLIDAQARNLGVVLTYVDLRRQAQYDYADSGYYYGSGYAKYYATE